MANYNFSRFDYEVESENQYVYEAYFKCVGCGKIYDFGLCIRGEPKLKVLDKEPDVQAYKEILKKTKQSFYSDIFK